MLLGLVDFTTTVFIRSLDKRAVMVVFVHTSDWSKPVEIYTKANMLENSVISQKCLLMSNHCVNLHDFVKTMQS